MRSIALLLGLLVAGCGNGSQNGDPDTDTDSGADTTTDTEFDPACEYPSGPYGGDAGNVVEDFSFDAVGGGTASLQQFHCDPSTSVLLIYGTAGWCPTCPTESGDLPDLYADFHDQGLEILAVVFEDDGGSPASLEFAEAYRDLYGFPFTTVNDPDGQIGVFLGTGEAPINVFVDLETMEVIDEFTGYSASSFRSDIETHLGI